MSLRGIFENQNQGGSRLQTHNSVEDLIKSTLGVNFLEKPINSVPPPASLPDTEPMNEFSILPDIDKLIQKENSKTNTESSNPVQPSAVSQPLYKTISTPQIPGSSKLENPIKSIDQPISKIPQERKEGAPVRKEIPQKYVEELKVGYDKKSKEYVLRRDRDETFECHVNIEGGSSSNPSSRLIIRTDVWNLIFDGSIKKDGTCIVHLKKLHIFPEGTIGKITLEVIVDDIVFVPWERPFRVSMSKKVSISKPILK